MTAVALPAKPRWRFAPKSFAPSSSWWSAGAAVRPADVGGLTLWNVQRLSYDATERSVRPRKGDHEYLQNYIATTVERTDLLFDRYHSEVNTLADSMQMVIDDPTLPTPSATLSASRRSPRRCSTGRRPATATGGRTRPAKPPRVTVWGYLLDGREAAAPEPIKEVRDTTVFDIFGPAIEQIGARPSCRCTTWGPMRDPILRSTPYNDQGQSSTRSIPATTKSIGGTFLSRPLSARSSPGSPTLRAAGRFADRHVRRPISTASPARPSSASSTVLTPDRKDVDGVVGVDLTLDQMAQIVETVHIAEPASPSSCIERQCAGRNRRRARRRSASRLTPAASIAC